jgi:hypothetical protein
MKLKRLYKVGTNVRFKWYENPNDDILKPYDYRLLSGRILQTNDIIDSVIIADKNNTFYCVSTRFVLNE